MSNSPSHKEKKIVKYLKGAGKVLILLAKEIEERGFDKESEELMSKIGSNLLFNAKSYKFLSE